MPADPSDPSDEPLDPADAADPARETLRRPPEPQPHSDSAKRLREQEQAALDNVSEKYGGPAHDRNRPQAPPSDA